MHAEALDVGLAYCGGEDNEKIWQDAGWVMVVTIDAA